ncbi:MAG TPA: DUF3488 and transglutaminase-like domain-containing protein [Terriglobales bacterium]|nr:DUF3488 and transglutaminase-like domain-containing protein [Terriglobales bacterium]
MGTFSIFSPPRPAPLAAHSAVQRYFEVALYLLIVTGFATLVSTGKLDLLSLFVVSTALLLRGRQLLRRDTSQLSEKWTTRLTVAYAAFWFVDWQVISANFVTATVHLVLFATVVRMFSVQRHRDHLYLIALSFAAVLASALWTVDTTFLAVFVVFLLLAVATFIAMEMKLSAEAAQGRARESGAVSRLGVSLSGTTVALVAAIFAGAAVLFFILPRWQARYLSSLAPRNELVTGFSDDVRLGDIGEIKRSSQVVMHLQIDGDPDGRYDLKWRGVALALFDGTRWSNPPGQRALHLSSEGGFDLSRSDTSVIGMPHPPRVQQFVRYRVLMEPIGTNVFFVAYRPSLLYGPYREIATDDAGTIYNTDQQRMVSAYRAVSDIHRPPAEVLRAASPQVAPQVALYYLQLPPVDPKVRALAEEITRGAADPYDKAVALERFLHDKYRYTLVLPKRLAKDPIADFLLLRKEGHCEYFASAMAVMLRSLGIPARLVNGFRTGEFNTITGSYIIRASQAHTWVEVFFPGSGWVSFDPTPADPKQVPDSWSRFLLYMDAAREFWREWIINYDFQHQSQVSQTVVSRGRLRFDRARMWLRRKYEDLIESARRTTQQVSTQPSRYGLRLVAMFALLLLLANAGKLWKIWRDGRVAHQPERAPHAAAAIWYARLTRRLARRGWRKLETQTPTEFLITIEDPALRRAVEEFTRRYHRARFGDSVEDARALPALYEAITGMRNA